MGLGLGRHAADGQDLFPGLRPAQRHPRRQYLLEHRRPTTRSRRLIIAGRGDRSYFDARACTSTASRYPTIQSQIPVVHPVIDHDYAFESPDLGRRAQLRDNLTSLSRDEANFDPITAAAQPADLCAPTTADPAVKTIRPIACCAASRQLSPASPPNATWRRTVIDPFGPDVHAVRHDARAMSPT